MTIQKPENLETGLEDFGVTDAVIPRMSIQHTEGVYKDNLSGEEFEEVDVIFLGLVKQRVLWHPQIAEDGGDNPMCKSQDFHFGFPNSHDNPAEKLFPWEESGFDQDDYDLTEQVKLPCESCLLKDWGSHPDKKKPYCSEQWTLPLLYNSTPDQDEPTWVPAIITFQKTSLKPLKAYLTSFARNNNPIFTAIARMGLDPRKRGNTIYHVGSFSKVGNTDQEDWTKYNEAYKEMREFLQADPEPKDDGDDEQPAPAPPKAAAPPKAPSKPAVSKPAVSKPAVAKPAPKVEKEPDIVDAETVEEDDDDFPF